MSASAKATATVQSWDENAYNEVEGTPKTVKASIRYGYEGDIEGEGVSQMLMVYVGNEAEYVGLERITGSIAGRSGTFVISALGSFKNGIASSTWNVVAGSGTGDLKGLRGSGQLEAPSGTTATVTLDYTLD